MKTVSTEPSDVLQSSKPASYEQWKQDALEHDLRTGNARWRESDESRHFDHRVIRRRYEELLALNNGDRNSDLLFYLNEGIHGNMGRMGNPALYGVTQFGTKQLVTDYITELSTSLTRLCDAPDISQSDKLDFFRRASHCFGRSALMLSGAGSLGPFHLGVVKALREQDLLPSVISGASAGSMVAAVLGSYSREEVLSRLQSLQTGQLVEETRLPDRRSERITVEHQREIIDSLIPDITFAESLEISGLHINISVAPTEVGQNSRLLNADTSPNVLLREAVMASCAVPGFFPPVQLAARNQSGERVPYVASRRWIDGSISEDLPVRRLTRLYGVNYFITSQTNPIVLWQVRDSDFDNSVMGRLMDVYQGAQRESLKVFYPYVMRTIGQVYPLNIYAKIFFSLALQEYTADVNIIPKQRWRNPAKLLSHLTDEETAALIREGEEAAWPKIEMIRNCTKVGRTLERCLARVEQQGFVAAA